MADKLLPCPFCGGDAEVFHSSDCEEDEEYSIYCGKCYCSTEKVCTYGEAVNLWNNRPSNWHTGTPTEEGWYLVTSGGNNSASYDIGKWDGESFCYMEYLNSADVVAWQKIEPYKEDWDG